jgi:release factor glutamine methyltransferase
VTLRECVTVAARTLAAAGVSAEDSRRDVTLLARWALGWDAARWLTEQERKAPADFAARLGALVERRAAHEPIAYITGTREFYGRPFRVTPAVLIPRPETELVIEEALAHLTSAGHELPSGAAVIDVGTGSGCLAITLALERPELQIVAGDTSDAALTVARDNAQTHGVADRIRFVPGSLIPAAAAPIALVVANPPYVAEADRLSLPKDVLDFEPAPALFAGPDGLDVIRALIPAAARDLVPGGALVMEIGQGQASEVDRLIRATGVLTVGHVRDDLQGIPRVVVVRKTSGVVLRFS